MHPTLSPSRWQAGPWRRELRLVLLLASFTTLYYLHRRITADHSQTLLSDLLHTWAWDLLMWACVVLMVSRLHARLPAPGPWRQAGLVALGLCAGALALLAYGLGSDWRMNGWRVTSDTLPQLAVYCLAWGLLLAGLHEFSWRRQRAADELQAAELQGVALRGELDQARTQLLQAQIEPHFLFNTLANVRLLLARDAEAARGLLDDLGRYLAAALPRLREEGASLAQEVELLQAFLAIHQVRMGVGRLQWRVDVPEALGAAALPPMLLLTLVENALKHGLVPLPEGGRIDIRAELQTEKLRLSVADNGAGMGSGSGCGMGLANVRARLKAAYGEAGRLELRLNQPRGVIAEILLPLHGVTVHASA